MSCTRQHRSPDVEGMETDRLGGHQATLHESAPQPRCRGDGNKISSSSNTWATCQHRSPDVEGMETYLAGLGLLLLSSQHRSPDVEGMETSSGTRGSG